MKKLVVTKKELLEMVEKGTNVSLYDPLRTDPFWWDEDFIPNIKFQLWPLSWKPEIREEWENLHPNQSPPEYIIFLERTR